MQSMQRQSISPIVFGQGQTLSSLRMQTMYVFIGLVKLLHLFMQQLLRRDFFLSAYCTNRANDVVGHIWHQQCGNCKSYFEILPFHLRISLFFHKREKKHAISILVSSIVCKQQTKHLRKSLILLWRVELKGQTKSLKLSGLKKFIIFIECLNPLHGKHSWICHLR